MSKGGKVCPLCPSSHPINSDQAKSDPMLYKKNNNFFFLFNVHFLFYAAKSNTNGHKWGLNQLFHTEEQRDGVVTEEVKD